MMKRYGLFAGNSYYPSGGMKDLLMCDDSLEELQRVVIVRLIKTGLGDRFMLSGLDAEKGCEGDPFWNNPWWHIYDFEEMKIVAQTEDE